MFVPLDTEGLCQDVSIQHATARGGWAGASSCRLDLRSRLGGDNLQAALKGVCCSQRKGVLP